MSSRDLVAKPGDPDLDMDLDGVSIDAILQLDNELIVDLSGGFGRWVCDGQMVQVDRVTEVHMVLGYASSKNANIVVERLSRWKERNVPLRFVAAPGRISLLIADRDDILPVPRS